MLKCEAEHLKQGDGAASNFDTEEFSIGFKALMNGSLTKQ
jgi:hypothetical protein